MDTFVEYMNVSESGPSIARALYLEIALDVWLLVEQLVEEYLNLIDCKCETLLGSYFSIAILGSVVDGVLSVHSVVKLGKIVTCSSPVHCFKLVGNFNVVSDC